MKLTAPAVGLLLAFVIATIGVFIAGQAAGASDTRLFAKDDGRRLAMVARACGKTGQLMQDPSTGAYSCMWRNADGETLVQAIPDAPYLEYVAQK